ncbi:MAG: hypothetical protein ABIQ27_03740 [Flavobacterium sp.]|uniref:hypothetical protein n=1 Tax=Flavobacterium sp. TaxID=239 RepID=UPI0032633E9B
MRKSIVIFLILVLVSCQKKETEPVAKPAEDFLETADLYSKVYYISPELNTEDCTTYSDGCDCCDGKILFLKNGTFISNFYCIPDESYNTGTFKIENKKLILDYSYKEAVYGPSKEDYSDEEESILRLDSVNCRKVSLEIIRCKNHYVFKSETDYYGEDKKTSFQLAINQYKRDGVWELLDIKE